jgi:hypothetical protein
VSRRALTRTAAGAMVLALVVGPGSTGPAAADKAGNGADDQANPVASDYRTDTYLSLEQKQLLDRLAERSTTRLAAESWAHAVPSPTTRPVRWPVPVTPERALRPHPSRQHGWRLAGGPCGEMSFGWRFRWTA